MQIPVVDYSGNVVAHVNVQDVADCGAVSYQDRLFIFRGGSNQQRFAFVEAKVFDIKPINIEQTQGNASA